MTCALVLHAICCTAAKAPYPRARRGEGEPGIIEIAENAAARVRTDCPVEAEAAGL
jgi:hypothetical protein